MATKTIQAVGSEGVSRNEATLYDTYKQESILMLKEMEEDDYNLPLPNLFSNYKYLYNIFTNWFIGYEKPYNYYYLVFKPFNGNYDKHYHGIDHIRKYLGKQKQYLITREILSNKVHYNVLVVSKDDLTNKHEKHTSRYKIHAQRLEPNVFSRNKVIDYMIKESHERYFHKGNDYLAVFHQ